MSTILKAAGRALAKVGLSTAASVGEIGAQGLVIAAGATAGKAINEITNRSSQLITASTGTYIPPDIQTTPYHFELSVANYSRSGPISIGALNYVDRFYIPLPMQLADGKSISFQDDKGLMPDAANKLQQTQAGTALSAFSGTTVNQLMVVVLDRPQFKNFELTWKFVPRNDKETVLLKQFIWKLNKYTSPGLFAGGAMFKFPKIFQMAFRANKSTTGNHLFDTLYRFKPAIVEKMRVNFAAGGMPAFYRSTNGPESVEITLSFKELEYWVSEDYENQETEAYGGSKSTASSVADLATEALDTIRRAL